MKSIESHLSQKEKEKYVWTIYITHWLNDDNDNDDNDNHNYVDDDGCHTIH